MRDLFVRESGNPKGPTVILLHGGPGLPGYMCTLAERLERDAFVVDYYQRGSLKSPSPGPFKIDDHVRDLDALIRRYTRGRKPLLIGSSWGAILALCYAAAKPGRIAKAIVIGTGPLDKACSEKFSATIAARLPYKEHLKARALKARFFSAKGSAARRGALYLEWCSVIFRVYNKDPRSFDRLRLELPHIKSTLETDADYEGRMASGKLVRDLRRIKDPVVAFHGDYDPIPWEGILPLLAKRVRNFRTRLLRGAGHVPWLERDPGEFLRLLKKDILARETLGTSKNQE